MRLVAFLIILAMILLLGVVGGGAGGAGLDFAQSLSALTILGGGRIAAGLIAG